ncbi:MAG TPA: hypothetical protein VFM73_05545 [Xanthomonadaceae bacterium]|nr:hypothetical protein [Xanthomonadaceae bacterium]
MKSRFVVAFALLVATFAAQGEGLGPRAVKDRIESSMLVAGTIQVDPQGRVDHFTIDRRDALPDAVNRLLDRAVPNWTFEPWIHDGRAVAVGTSMRVRITANKLAGDEIVVRVAGASFGGRDKVDHTLHPTNRPPMFPREPLRAGVTGTVYLLGRVGLDGTMQEVIAEQVNLRTVASERDMERLREKFERASIKAAMTWTYDVPEEVLASGKPHWSVRVPVDFETDRRQRPGYGEWDSYIPGPRRVAAWIEEEDDGSTDVASLRGGELYRVGQGLKLLTPLEGKG